MPGHRHPAGCRAWLGLKRPAADSRFLPAPPQSAEPRPESASGGPGRSTWLGGRCCAACFIPVQEKECEPSGLNRPSAGSRALVPTPCRVPVCWPRSAARSSAPPDSSPSPVSWSRRPLALAPPLRAARKFAAAPSLCLRCLQTWSKSRGWAEGRPLRLRPGGRRGCSRPLQLGVGVWSVLEAWALGGGSGHWVTAQPPPGKWLTQNKGIRCVGPLFSHLYNEATSLVAQTVKNLSAMRETQVQSLGREDPLEEEMATQSSTLARRI